VNKQSENKDRIEKRECVSVVIASGSFLAVAMTDADVFVRALSL
jgi:hypothetical protein